MDSFDVMYEDALLQVEIAITNELNKTVILESLDVTNALKTESSLDAWDYCYAIACGLAGVFISTSEDFGKYLEEIHQAASGNSGEYDKFQSFLGRVFHHEGDHIDLIDGTFKNRNGENAYGLFHRLLWGHDIFSLKSDNPFRIMYEQKGISGVLQVVRHLLADTTSKQGLPLPGSSFFDYKNEKNNTSNYLIKIAQNLSNESTGLKNNAQEIYSHMMTIRAQDVTAGVVVKGATDIYFKIRGVNDKIRCLEIQLIAYSVNFLGEAVFGACKQNGIPYINVPLAGMIATTFAKFCYQENKERFQI